jgi:hypothetical protein
MMTMNNGMRGAETQELILANQKLGLQDTKIRELKAILDVWAFSAQGEVTVKTVDEVSGPVLIVAFKKGNGVGFTKEYDREKLVHYADSPSTLVEELVEEIYIRFYKEEIRNRVTKLVDQGLRNAAQIEGKV